MHIHLISPLRFRHTMFWAILLSALIVGVAATLARASYNFSAALTQKPDLAVYLLLADEEITQTTLLKETRDERDYLAETKDGPKLIRLLKGEHQWFVGEEENLH